MNLVYFLVDKCVFVAGHVIKAHLGPSVGAASAVRAGRGRRAAGIVARPSDIGRCSRAATSCSWCAFERRAARWRSAEGQCRRRIAGHGGQREPTFRQRALRYAEYHSYKFYIVRYASTANDSKTFSKNILRRSWHAGLPT
nr:unnamed protein product [Callosobruchus analis]